MLIPFQVVSVALVFLASANFIPYSENYIAIYLGKILAAQQCCYLWCCFISACYEIELAFRFLFGFFLLSCLSTFLCASWNGISIGWITSFYSCSFFWKHHFHSVPPTHRNVFHSNVMKMKWNAKESSKRSTSSSSHASDFIIWFVNNSSRAEFL